MSLSRPAGMFCLIAGVVWTGVLLWAGGRIPVPIAMIQPTLMGSFFGPGLVLVAMIGWLSLRPETPGAEINRKVVQNTVEQIALALCLWPLIGFFSGAGTVLALGIGFAIARLIYWLGAHLSPGLRALGFAMTFLPTLLAACWTLWRLASG